MYLRSAIRLNSNYEGKAVVKVGTEVERKTLNGEMNAQGSGALISAYWNLLSGLTKSGCVIIKIRVIPNGYWRSKILYTIEGTDEELAIARTVLG